ncbi:MAG: hypothetical protein AAF847_01425 [Bacteroidota bacterium]
MNCKSVVYGSGEENNSDFIEINERLFSKSGSENIGLQEDNAPNMLLRIQSTKTIGISAASLQKAISPKKNEAITIQ